MTTLDPSDAAAGRRTVEVDGSRGEGGGQILRTSLALAMITGQALHMQRIRAGRAKPGLRRQHLACVEAAARLCHAEVQGAELSSQELSFVPGAITGGELAIDIGTAGATSLVVQTILVPAIAAGRPLRAVIRGGTHNPMAPPFEFLERVYLPHLRAMGADVALSLDRHGFAISGAGSPPGRPTASRSDEANQGDDGALAAAASSEPDGRPLDGDPSPPRDGDRSKRVEPTRTERSKRAERSRRGGRGNDSDDYDGHRSGKRDSFDPGMERFRKPQPAREPAPEADAGLGQLTLSVGAGALRPIQIVEAGPVTARHATAILGRLPAHIADRELQVVRQRLGIAAADCEVRAVDAGPANLLLLEIERASGRELVSVFGEKRLRAELVAARACDELARFLDAGVPVSEHLADQLLLPLAVAGGGRFRTAPLSLHATTNIETIQQFLPLPISVIPDGEAVIVQLG